MTIRFHFWVARIVGAIGLGVMLGACGGGGGGDTPPAPPPPVNNAPSVNAGNDQQVARNVPVSLSGTATDDGGASGLTLSWTQTAGTAVTLTNADSLDAQFTSPDVAADETLQFSLTATDSAGQSDTDNVSVTVIFDVPPTVSVQDDRTVEQNSSVTLVGTPADDNDIAALAYQWTQLSGPAVTLSDANTAVATFTAPATTAPVELSFRLTVTDASAQTASDDIVITVVDDLSMATVRGNAQFAFVPFSANRLDYDSEELRPIRGATIQLINADTNAIIESAVLDDTGGFSFIAPPSTNVFLRIRAELKRTGTPAWDVEVRDNTSSTSLPLAQRPLYVLDGAPFDSGAGLQQVTITAASGWDGTRYSGTRAAAPFSVLDTIYRAVQLVVSVDQTAVFAPLDAFWSINNTPIIGGAQNIDTGELGTSFYRGDIDSLFLLGRENIDTEEYDTHVVAHEWGHYFEDNFSRSDSTGGSHNLIQQLDPRLAFGEGFGNAVAAMIMGDETYFDSQGTQQNGGFTFSLEDGRETSSVRGWYNERSVQSFLYDVFDSTDDAGDTVSFGFAAVYNILTNEQSDGTAFTTVYPFADALRARFPAEAAEIAAMLQVQRISGNSDAYGNNETEDAGRPADVLPLYTVVTPDAAPVNVCSTNAFDDDEDGNKLGVRRFVRIPVSVAGNYTVTIETSNPPAIGASDPDAFVYRRDFVGGGDSPDNNRETFTLQNLTPGDYVMVLYEFSYLRGNPVAISQPDDQTCFDVSVTS